ncbi:hypothetical protein ABW20_dc0107703 [Dactylellina cionopaga]|nr:hypothetical protein ABW20_dc0107703 [Dactylellina cionopaga]
MWGLVDPQEGLRRETQLRSTDDFWGEMEKGGSLVMRHQRTRESALAIIEVIIRKRRRMTLKIQDEMVNESKELEDTGAGMKVNEDLIEAERQHKMEITALREDMKTADAASKKEIAELIQKQQADIEENKRQREALMANMKDLENERAKDRKKWEDFLSAQAIKLKAKDDEIKQVQADLERQKKQHNQNREEQQRMQRTIQEMEKERAKDKEALERSVAQATRQSTGFWSSVIGWIAGLFI